MREGGNDYQEIIVGITELASSLTRRPEPKRFKRILAPMLRFRILRAIFFRPVTYEPTRTHLASGLANVSEISRDKFRNNPKLAENLASTLENLANAILTENTKLYCNNLANFYRILYFQDTNNKASAERKGFILSNIIDKILHCVDENDVFNAYNHLLTIKEDSTSMRNLDDYEIILFHDLSNKLECFVQGHEYYVRENDIRLSLNELTKKCKTIKEALSRNKPVDILLAAA